MTTPALIQRLNTTIGKRPIDAIAHELWLSAYPLNQLIGLCLHKEQKVAFHAAWVLEEICFHDFGYFLTHFNHFVEIIPDVKNDSVKRHFAKLLAFSLEQAPNEKIISCWIQTNSEPAAQTLFDWLIDPAIKPGVKVWCINALTFLAPQYEWVKEELLPTVESLLPAASPGLRAGIKRFLKKYTK